MPDPSRKGWKFPIHFKGFSNSRKADAKGKDVRSSSSLGTAIGKTDTVSGGSSQAAAGLTPAPTSTNTAQHVGPEAKNARSLEESKSLEGVRPPGDTKLSEDTTPPEDGRPLEDNKPPEDGVTTAQLLDLAQQRNALWKDAFDALRADKPDLVANFDAIVHDSANLDTSIDIFSSDGIAAIINSQKSKMESRQWKYHWFGKDYKVRDTAEGILTAVNKIQPAIAYGMQFAPPFVSLPWSAISIVIPVSRRVDTRYSGFPKF